MSTLQELAKSVGSLRYARDLIEYGASTKPWWDFSSLRAQMTRTQAEEQRRSFAYGNVSLSNPLVTRAMIDEVANRMTDPERERVIPRTNSERTSK